MRFQNREQAALLLLEKLISYKDRNALVLGIPLGAVPMAKIIADGLAAELGVILVHKVSSSMTKELAIGCIGISGYLHRLEFIEDFGIPESYVKAAAEDALARLNERKAKYALPDYHYNDRIVIIVDDGIATGATAICAVREVQIQGAKKVVVATPVASKSSCQDIRPLVDQLVALDEPEDFVAVGKYFEDFSQVTEDEVLEILHGKRQASG